MKFYLAASLQHIDAQRQFAWRMSRDGANRQTHDWTLDPIVDASDQNASREVLQRQLAGVADCDVFFLLLPGGRGSHFELGYALALGKRVFVLTTHDDHDLIAAYHHPLITILSLNDIWIY